MKYAPFAALAISVSSGATSAEIISLICENSRREYVVAYDPPLQENGALCSQPANSDGWMPMIILRIMIQLALEAQGIQFLEGRQVATGPGGSI